MEFSCGSTDEAKFIKTRNNSHNRSQVFYANRQDCWLERQRTKPSKLVLHQISKVKIDHCTQEEEAAMQRGRRQLNHMKQAASTIHLEQKTKFAKRIVSPLRT